MMFWRENRATGVGKRLRSFVRTHHGRRLKVPRRVRRHCCCQYVPHSIAFVSRQLKQTLLDGERAWQSHFLIYRWRRNRGRSRGWKTRTISTRRKKQTTTTTTALRRRRSAERNPNFWCSTSATTPPPPETRNRTKPARRVRGRTPRRRHRRGKPTGREGRRTRTRTSLRGGKQLKRNPRREEVRRRLTGEEEDDLRGASTGRRGRATVHLDAESRSRKTPTTCRQLRLRQGEAGARVSREDHQRRRRPSRRVGSRGRATRRRDLRNWRPNNVPYATPSPANRRFRCKYCSLFQRTSEWTWKRQTVKL